MKHLIVRATEIFVTKHGVYQLVVDGRTIFVVDPGNPVTPIWDNKKTLLVEESLDMAYGVYDIIEQGTPCDFCGQPVEFFDDDWVRCPSCGAEYSNMDYIADDINVSDDINESDSFEG